MNTRQESLAVIGLPKDMHAYKQDPNDASLDEEWSSAKNENYAMDKSQVL